MPAVVQYSRLVAKLASPIYLIALSGLNQTIQILKCCIISALNQILKCCIISALFCIFAVLPAVVQYSRLVAKLASPIYLIALSGLNQTLPRRLRGAKMIIS